MPNFGIREVCDITFTKVGAGAGPDSFSINTAKMSTLESSSTTVYAQGGAGYSRLMAWEGEKNLTFTVEDALISHSSFHALTGASYSAANNKYTYTVYPTSFAAYYKITATTLFRDYEDGNDHVATITIPKAKLQTTLNLSMSPTGDPASFTFTFDAFPGTMTSSETKDYLFKLEVDQGVRQESDSKTKVIIYNGTTEEIKEVESATSLTINSSGAIALGSTTFTMTLGTDEILTNLTASYERGTTSAPTTISLTAGQAYTFYVV